MRVNIINADFYLGLDKQKMEQIENQRNISFLLHFKKLFLNTSIYFVG